MAGLSLSGMPLFGGFISKTMLEGVAFSMGAGWIAIVAVLGSIFTFAGIARLLWNVFLPLHLPPVGPAVQLPGQPPSHRPHVGTTVGLSSRGSGAPVQPSPKPTNVFEAPLLALLPMLVPVVLSIAIGVSPRWAARNLAWPAATSLAQPQLYIRTVLAYPLPDILPAPHFEAPPDPFDPSHWLVPLVVLLAGSLLAYATLKPEIVRAHPWLNPARAIARLAMAWHTGLVSDYVLWNAFSTTVIIAGLVIATLL
jgi:NADH:ubiquinone oxidoreductase subunit 5 (subunit L)/multisubunit Na+/H+ antiporter MnhA subunit